VDREGFGYRVMVARYGEEAGRLEGGRKNTGWCRGDGGGCFADSVVRKVGDGVDTYFGYYRWLGGVPFCVRFNRLFELVENKSTSVASMYSLGWEEGGEAWMWR
jgi:hypothetical protein